MENPGLQWPRVERRVEREGWGDGDRAPGVEKVLVTETRNQDERREREMTFFFFLIFWEGFGRYGGEGYSKCEEVEKTFPRADD